MKIVRHEFEPGVVSHSKRRVRFCGNGRQVQ